MSIVNIVNWIMPHRFYDWLSFISSDMYSIIVEFLLCLCLYQWYKKTWYHIAVPIFCYFYFSIYWKFGFCKSGVKFDLYVRPNLVGQRLGCCSHSCSYIHAFQSEQAAASIKDGKRILFRFDRAAFSFKFLPFKVPYPVPFKLLGDEAKGWLDTTYLSHSGNLRISRGNKVIRHFQYKHHPNRHFQDLSAAYI